MFEMEYLVKRINGDYAMLVPVEEPTAEENPVARALLPDAVEEGSRLLCRDFEYSLL